MFKIFAASLWVVVISLFFRAWPLELIVSFFAYEVVFSTLLVAAFIWMRPRFKNERYEFAIVPWAVMMIFFLSTFIPGHDQMSRADKDVTVYTHNMLYSIDNSEAVGEQAKAVGADIIALQETYAEHVESIRQIVGFRDTYVSECECSDNADELGLISRYPILSAETVEVDIVGGRMVEAILNIEGQETRMIVLHLPVPTLPNTYSCRERGYSKLAEVIQNSEVPTILAGDFNTTVWSPSLRNFSSEVSDQISNVSTYGGLAKSWCDSVTGFACLRIDHIFVDNQFFVDKVKIGNEAGSDHKALIVDMKI